MKLVSTNPWRLTPREVEVMERDHAKSVRLKMGETGHLGYLRKWIEFRARQEA